MNLEKIVTKYSSEFIFIRMISYLIDIFITFFFSSIISLIIFIITKNFQLSILLSVFIITFLFYFILAEGSSGYTLGKLIFRIKVVDYKGNPPGFLKALIRNLMRFFELNPLLFLSLIGPLIAFSSSKKQRLGDLTASTYVIHYNDLIETNELKNLVNNNMDLSEIEIQNLLTSNKINKKLSYIFIPLSILFLIATLLLPNLSYLNLSDKYKNFNLSKTFTSSDKSCKISLPRGWNEERSNNSNSLLYIVNTSKNTNINIFKYEKSDYKNNLIYFCESKVESMSKTYNDISKTEFLNVVINNDEGIEFTCYYKNNNKIYGNLLTIIEHNDYFFLISSQSLKSDFENNKIVLKNISKTLYISDKNEEKKFTPEFEKKLSNSRAITEN